MKTPNLPCASIAGLGVALFCAINVPGFAGTIVNPTSPETVWTDADGSEIINNGGNILRDEDGMFYWYGWNKYAKTVRVFSSATLASDSWELRATLLANDGFHGRPDVIKRPDGVYVMIVECGTPNQDGRNGVQYYTSSGPIGPFALQLQENQVLKNNAGELVSMGDKGIYQDEDDARTAYLLCTTDDDGNTNGTHKIIRLKPDYIGQEAVVQSWGPVNTNRREALAVFKRGGTYYMTSSGTHGWNSGATWYKTASSIDGTWTGWANLPASPSSGNSFNTQHDYVLKIAGTSATSFIYCGDRWSKDTGIGFGRQAWYPLTFDDAGVPTLRGEDVWSIDPSTGAIDLPSTPPPPPPLPAHTLVFGPTKDSMVKEAAPATNFGAAAQMQVSGQPGFRKVMFVAFAVSGIPSDATVTGASLLLTSKTTGTGRTVTAHAVADTQWSESAAVGIKWNNAPTLGAVLSTVANHIAGEDSVWEVSAHVVGNGVFALGLDSVFSGDTNFHARESGSGTAPSLVVTYSVPDTAPPVLQLPANIELEATGPDGAVASFTPTAEDAVDGAVPVTLSHPSGATFSLGTTTVTASATDAAGNTATGSFTVTVIDGTAPAFTSLTASPDLLWPANHKLVSVSLGTTVSDVVDQTPATRIVSVTSNEPANGIGDGDTEPDWMITGGLTLQLRAERVGGGAGRIYTITVEARDDSGNATTRSVEVSVPHDKR